MAQKGRRTGLGITAEGDMLAALGLVYGSEEAIAFAVEVHGKNRGMYCLGKFLEDYTSNGELDDFGKYRIHGN